MAITVVIEVRGARTVRDLTDEGKLAALNVVEHVNHGTRANVEGRCPPRHNSPPRRQSVWNEGLVPLDRADRGVGHYERDGHNAVRAEEPYRKGPGMCLGMKCMQTGDTEEKQGTE